MKCLSLTIVIFFFLWAFLSWPSLCLLRSAQLIYEQRLPSQGVDRTELYFGVQLWDCYRVLHRSQMYSELVNRSFSMDLSLNKKNNLKVSGKVMLFPSASHISGLALSFLLSLKLWKLLAIRCQKKVVRSFSEVLEPDARSVENSTLL